MKIVPQGAIDKLVNPIMHIIHAFTQVDKDTENFMENGILKMAFGV